MDSHNQFLILGIANGGLFMARQLRKAWPDAVIYAIGNPKDIGRYSNTIDQFFAASTEDEILSSIDKVLGLANGEWIQAYMCSNPMLECLAIHHPEVFDRLRFENDWKLYHRIVDKTALDLLCRQLGVARPVEYSLKEKELASITFPVVVKPLEKANTIGASKCAYLDDREALVKYLNKTDGLGIRREDLICQQCVEGDNRWEYGYGGYFQNGKPLVDICFHQFKQVPQGLCCYSREMTNLDLQRQMRDLVAPLLHELNYNGFMEFDVKQDAKTKVLYLLDVNPRPWRSVDMLTVKLGDSTIFTPSLNNKKVAWHYYYRELYTKKNKKNVSYKISRQLTGGNGFVRHETLFDKDDREPLKQQRRLDRNDLLKKLKK